MTRRLRFVAIALAAGLGLSACANNEAKESDVVNAMRDAGLNEEDAECVGAGFQEEFGDDQDLFDQVADADTPEDLPDDTRATIEAIFDDCGIEPIGGAGEGPATDPESTDPETTEDESTADESTGDESTGGEPTANGQTGAGSDATTTTAAS